MTFEELQLSKPLVKAVTAMGFTQPTPIQEMVIPEALKVPRDIIALAQTGTGKTAAFGLPLIEYIDPSINVTQALILSPTRELCQQISAQIEQFSQFIPKLRQVPVFGGAAISRQISQLKRPPQIIIATPGRLLDLIRRRVVNLSEIQFFVLDEGDEMLNMGFQEDIDKILESAPDEKTTWLFSATMPAGIRKIVHNYMTEPFEVTVSPKNIVNENISHQFIIVKASEKNESIKRFLDVNPDMHGIIFCRTRRNTQQLAENLINSGYRSDALHGDMSQGQRDRVMQRFKSHQLQILVATDVAARGIDVSDLTHIIHHQLPDDMAFYTHRAGRTARAGKKGISLAFITNHDRKKIDFIQRKNKIRFDKVSLPMPHEVVNQRILHWADSILETEAYETISDKILSEVNDRLRELDREELLKHFITVELKKLSFKETDLIPRRKPMRNKDEGRKSFEKRGKTSSRRSERSERSDRSKRFEKSDWSDKKSKRRSDKKSAKRAEKKGKYPKDKRSSSGPKEKGNYRYFINLGKMDGIQRNELIEFISNESKVKKGQIQHVEVMERHAFFEVDKENSGKISSSFKNIKIEGRLLRVNRDD